MSWRVTQHILRRSSKFVFINPTVSSFYIVLVQNIFNAMDQDSVSFKRDDLFPDYGHRMHQFVVCIGDSLRKLPNSKYFNYSWQIQFLKFEPS